MKLVLMSVTYYCKLCYILPQSDTQNITATVTLSSKDGSCKWKRSYVLKPCMYVEHCVCSLENAEQKPFKIRYDNHYAMPRTSIFLMYAMKETCCDNIQYTHFH